MKVAVYNQKGNKTKITVELADNVFGAELNKDLMAQALYVFQSNQRLGTQKTKGISEVSGGGRKPWKQKTPDKARSGSIRSPIWVGGGRSHPISPREWRLQLPQKMRQGAMFSALSSKLTEELLKIVDSFEVSENQLAKQVGEIYSALGDNKKLLIITKEKNSNLILGAQSIDKVKVIMAGEMNIFDIFSNDVVVISQDAVEMLNDKWGTEVKVVAKSAKVKKVSEEKETK